MREETPVSGERQRTNNGKNNGNARRAGVEEAVLERYEQAAREVEAGLCVPVNYDRSLLEVIPEEIIRKDYGCGDPSRYVREGETVLDLGSGSGKACYIICQIVGPKGKVIGVDFNEEMLVLARKYQDAVGQRLGYHNVEFRRGRIQNLKLNLDLVEEYLTRHPVHRTADLFKLREFEERISQTHPLIPDESIDVIVSNCVLNLVRSEDKRQLFSEMYRVLKKGGRVAIADIVSDEPVPDHLKHDPELWSGCVSGAFQEEELLRAFEEAKFYGMHIEEMRAEPYQTIEGIEFRSITLTAYKGKEGPCIERNQAVIYRGPWKQVVDDDNHVLPRGVRVAVCDKTYQLYAKPPYQDQVIPVPPREEIPLEEAEVFDCRRTERRHPRETKGMDYKATQTSPNVCGPGSACCP
ncbi:MAG: methyltransferase [Candidatus Methylomirabilota bacterium]|nr:MAG: methyltransferase [candidate division NC10 bacterium]